MAKATKEIPVQQEALGSQARLVSLDYLDLRELEENRVQEENQE